MKLALSALVLLVALAAVGRCGSSSSGSSDVNSAHPGALAISSPTASTGGRAAARGIITSSASMDAKKAILEALFSATALADCAVSLTLVTAGNANCYGPNADYVDHPDGTLPNSGSLPGSDLGLMEATDGSTQACAAAQMNQRVKGGASFADAGLFGTASMICAARVSGLAKPAVGASVDVTSAVAGLVSINGTAITVTAATLSREADTTDGFPVYVSEITGTTGTTTYSIRLKHVPTDATNATNRGKVSVTVAVADGSKPGNCNISSATGHNYATSVEYEKASATSVKFLMRSAQFCGSDADPFKSATDKTVDLSKKVSGGTPKGWANDANFLAASIDPSAKTGNFAYAWQAGFGDSNSRALSLAIVASGSDLNGTAFYGYGDDIATTDGSIDRMICNWTGPGSTHTGLTKAQKQTMTKVSGSPVFTSVSTLITYDPVNLCESGASGFSLTWNTAAGTPTTRTADTTTMDLVDVSTIATDFTLPTAPTAAE